MFRKATPFDLEQPVRQVIHLEPYFSHRFEDIDVAECFPKLSFPIWTESLFRANEIVNLYTDFHVGSVLERVGISSTSVRDDGSLKPEFDIDPERAACVHWLLAKSAHPAFVRIPEVELGRQSLRQVILGDPRNEALEINLDLLDVVAAGYEDFLLGGCRGKDILFNASTSTLWERYFDNRNPLYAPTNRLAAYAAKDACVDLERPLQVLEVGAGCGSGTEALVDELGDRIERIVVSDISPAFLRKARDRVTQAAGTGELDVKFQLLDLNQTTESWRLSPQEFDLVFAVNTLHGVSDVVDSLRRLGDLLVVGGRVVLGECVRPASGCPLHPEFIFQLLDSYRNRQPRFSGERIGGFLDMEGWRRIFLEAGFSEPRTLPDFDKAVSAYEAHSLAAMVAEKL